MKRLIEYLFSSISKDTDSARRERVLRVLLVGVIVLTSCLLMTLVVDNRFTTVRQGGPVQIVAAFVLIFWALFFFSKTGFHKVVAYVFVIVLFVATTYVQVAWGVDASQGLLLLALVIVMSGILVGTKFGIITIIICTFTLFSVGYLQINNIIAPNRYWVDEPLKYRDLAVWVITLGVLGLVSWLFNLEMEKALKRARASEKALQNEKDSLEIKVEKRTRELQKSQLEKVMQIYRFADFGKLAAGLFHDLVTPLNVVSLNLENLKEETDNDTSKNIKEIRQILKRAIYSTKSIEKFVKDTRLELQGQQTKCYFSLVEEIDNVLKELADKALDDKVELSFNSKNTIRTYGNPFRLHQLAANLISNAIDSFADVKRKSNRNINIRLYKQNKLIIFEVEDFGIGIPKGILPYIFDSFYSTKPVEEGMGIGLTICKDIVEKDFGGDIKVKSEPQKGTIFRVGFPIKKTNGI